MDNVLHLLGIARKAGRVEVGEEPVGAAARAKKARVIFVAQDAAPSSVRRAQSFARTGSTLCVTLPAGKDTLGRSLGRTSVAMCAVTDIGFAQSLVQKLAVLDAAYQDTAYGEEETVILHVQADKNHEYSVDEDDMNSLVLKILRLDEIQG